MERRYFLSLIVAASLCAGTATAASLQDNFSAQLRSQGFKGLRYSRTWLGRSRITAQSKTHNREIIYNPRTGEILRDFSSVIGSASTQATNELFDPERNGSDSSSDGGSDSSSDGSSDSSNDSTSDSGSGGGDGQDSDSGGESDHGDSED